MFDPYIEIWMRLDILSSKPYPSAIPEFVAHLIKDNALGNLCGKMLGILSFYSATKNMSRDMLYSTFGILKSVDSYDPVRPPIKLRNFKCC